MKRKKRGTVELRFYEPPQDDYVLALLGQDWVRVYGQDVDNLHFHNLMEIGYCRDGRGTVFFDNQGFLYTTGSITVIPANYPHSTLSEGLEANYWEYLFFDPMVILRRIYPNDTVRQKMMENIMNENPNIFLESENRRIAAIIKMIMEEMRVKQPYYRDTVKGLLRSLCVEIVRLNDKARLSDNMNQQTEVNIAIKPALDYITQCYASPIKAGELAEVCNMSEAHLRRLFKDYVKMSLIDYLNLVRVQNACELLKHTDHSMDFVAEKVGFSTTSTFNRNFKKFIGTSPYQWKIDSGNYEQKLLGFNIAAKRGW